MKKITLFLFIITYCLSAGCSEDNLGEKGAIAEFTLPQMKWTSYDWGITKSSITAIFELDGTIPAGATIEVNCMFGTNEANLTPIAHTVLDKWNYKYSTERLTGLESGTTYILRVDYSSGEQRGSLTKEIKTMPDYSDLVVDNSVQRAAHKIVWENQANLKQISPDNIFAAYPRIVRTGQSSLACVYHGGTIGTPFLSVYMQTSADNGDSWSDASPIISITEPRYEAKYKRFMNPEILKLQNGNYLLSVTAIGAEETNDNCHTLVLISSDNCSSWSEPIIAGRGRSWEPMVIQLPGGELELLVSSEAQWWQVTNPMPQEILCTRSTDNGQTWTKYIRASYSHNRRDGMPSAVVMQGNKGVLFSIEVISDQGFGSPTFVHRAMDKDWDPIPWDGIASENRWRVQMALNNGNTNGAAPYTIQLTTGEIVLMAQVNPKTASIWQTAYPRIVVCDNTGHGYTDADKTTPVNLPNNQGYYYGSLFQRDENTILLPATHCSYSGSMPEYSCIKVLKGNIVAK